MNEEDSLYRISRILALLRQLAESLSISLPPQASAFQCGSGLTIDGKLPTGIDITALGAPKVTPTVKKTYRKTAEEIIRSARETLDEAPLTDEISVKSENDSLNLSEFQLKSFMTCEGESVSVVSLNTLYMALKVSNELRIDGSGEKFPRFFRCLLSSLWEELYVNEYLLGVFYRECECFTWKELVQLNDCVRMLLHFDPSLVIFVV